MDTTQALRQIGSGNFLAISGGRWSVEDERLVLPVAHGYRVTVELTPSDTYTVRREYKRNGRIFERGIARDVFCDTLGETCYRASCFYDVWGDE